MEEREKFEEMARITPQSQIDAFVVNVEGFEGPADVLLAMARNQKVDITQISILALADQYLLFISKTKDLNIDLAADYLVMAAWLAYLKSRLLLPDLSEDGEPTGAEMAAALHYQLKRLEAIQEIGKKLLLQPQLGNDFYSRGSPETFRLRTRTIYELTFAELLRGYLEHRRRRDGSASLIIETFETYTVEQAIVRIKHLLSPKSGWSDLLSFLPRKLKASNLRRSAIASTFAASLELAKEGNAALRQLKTFGIIHIRQGEAKIRRASSSGNKEQSYEKTKNE